MARPARKRLAIAAAAAAGALAAQVLLMTFAPYLLSEASFAVGFASLALTVTAVRAFALGRAASRYAERNLAHSAALQILTEIRVGVYEGLERITPGWEPERRAGDVLARLDADVDSLDAYFVRGLIPSTAAAVAGALACLVLAVLYPPLGVALAGALLAVGVAIPLLSRRAAGEPGADMVAARGKLHAELTDTIAGMADLVAYGATESALERVAAAGEASARASCRLGQIRRSATATGVAVAGLAAIACLWLAIPAVVGGELRAVLLATVPLVALASFEGVVPLGDAYRQNEVSRAAATRTFALIDSPPTVSEPAEPLPAPAPGPIRFEAVSFSYGSTSANVLDDLSFELSPGARFGIMGPSGAGKTTVTQLLLRFRDPIGGTITIGGIDLRRYASEDVRALIGVVPQHPYLFHSTLRDNLLLADGSATDGELARACEKAQLGSWLAALPNGLSTMVGEGGHALSGGERQLVAIARLFLRAAPIAVLDEPTANLDAVTERAVIGEISDFAEGRSLVVISHRPEPMSLADDIVELSTR
jgi:thiol reductant ABC exporter CydC subunit